MDNDVVVMVVVELMVLVVGLAAVDCSSNQNSGVFTTLNYTFQNKDYYIAFDTRRLR